MSKQLSEQETGKKEEPREEKLAEQGSSTVLNLGNVPAQEPSSVSDGGLGMQPQGGPRFHRADRSIVLPAITLDQLLEPDHPARDVWKYIEDMDLSSLYNRIRAREHTRGRSPFDPRILVALWLYGILYGVISARRLAELCLHHHAFRWLAGDHHVNHHTLSDFLVNNLDFLEGLFKHSIEVLAKEGLVDLDRVGQDGMRVRASAGAASFHRTETLKRIVQEAQAKLDKVQKQLDSLKQQGPQKEAPTHDQDAQPQAQKEFAPTPQPSIGDSADGLLGKLAAQKRAAEEAIERANEALARMPEMEAKKETGEEKANARVSSTDPEATTMKMADGGYRPAYNFQYCTTTNNKIIVGVEVVTIGSDQGQLPPMMDNVEETCGERPKNVLVDGGFVNKEDIDKVQAGKEGKAGAKVYAPVPKPKKAEVDRYAPKPDDSKETAEWRQRMGTDEAKEIYKERAATAELVNAQARNRGLIRLLVRSLQKVRAVALWFATVHNMARAFALIPSPEIPSPFSQPGGAFTPA